MYTDQEFVQRMEAEFPNEDWDAVPDPDTFPDIYIVKGRQFINGRIEGFTVDKEYATLEEAEKQIDRCKTWDNIEVDSIVIEAQKPSDAVYKYFAKECLDRIKKGEKVFPMYLP